MNLGLLNLISFKLLAKQKLCECKLHWKMVRKSCEILRISEISQMYFDNLVKIYYHVLINSLLLICLANHSAKLSDLSYR